MSSGHVILMLKQKCKEVIHKLTISRISCSLSIIFRSSPNWSFSEASFCFAKLNVKLWNNCLLFVPKPGQKDIVASEIFISMTFTVWLQRRTLQFKILVENKPGFSFSSHQICSHLKPKKQRFSTWESIFMRDLVFNWEIQRLFFFYLSKPKLKYCPGFSLQVSWSKI